MKTKIRRYLSIVGVFAISLALMFVLAGMKSSPKRKPVTDDRPVISVLQIHNSPIQVTVPVIGRLNAQQKVDLLAEVSGVLESSGKAFLTGQTYKAGEVMLRISQEETELTLKAQRSNLLTAIAALLPELKIEYPESYKRWNGYLQAFDIDGTTQALPTTSNEREKFMVANKGIFNSYYSIKSQESRLEKYTIRAPFDGALIQSSITPGNLVRSGQLLGVFIRPGNFDLETSVSINDVKHIKLGDQVLLGSDQVPGQWTGRVSRISQGIDQNSQMIRIFVAVSAPELRENMFLKGTILTSTFIQGMELPRKMLQGGNQVLEVVDGQILFKTVEVVSTRGEYALVRGLPDDLLISSKTANLYEGIKVKIAGAEDPEVEAPKKPKKG